MNVKLLLVDDHPMTRTGLSQTLAKEANLTVVGEASRGEIALKMAAELMPDLVLMDVHLPDFGGIEATRRLRDICPSAKVIIFSGDPDRALVNEALQAGACGYVMKSGVVGELLQAVDFVMQGRLYLSPEINSVILEDYRQSLAGDEEPPKPLLTARDTQVLKLVTEGKRNKEMADSLGISVKSVEAYRSRLMKKLGYSTAAELVRYAIREGIAVP